MVSELSASIAGEKLRKIMFEIGNTYGGLEIKEENNKYYWTIGGYGSDGWCEITKSLYDELVSHRDSE